MTESDARYILGLADDVEIEDGLSVVPAPPWADHEDRDDLWHDLEAAAAVFGARIESEGDWLHLEGMKERAELRALDIEEAAAYAADVEAEEWRVDPLA